MTEIFPNRMAWQTFFILFFSFIIFLGASLFLFNAYSQLNRTRFTPVRVSNEINRAVIIARSAEKQAEKPEWRRFSHPGFRLWVSSRAGPRFYKLEDFTKEKIDKILEKKPRFLRLSIKLNEDKWLNVVARIGTSQRLLAGFVLALVLLFSVLVLLCAWVVRRLAVPVEQFAKAAKRFGVDQSAPPMAETGHPSLREASIAFNDMQAKIRQLITDRTQMLAAISHDLRTPITRIKLRTESMQDEAQYAKLQADILEMEQMITSILMFTRDHMREEQVEKFDISALAESICHDMLDMGKKVTFTSAGERITFAGRLNALKRALTNLIDNAVKYGKQAEVDISLKQDGLQIKICDSGSGIPEAELEKVFAPFYRVDAARSPQHAGTGLGLAVSRDIIRAHGGEITLYNRKPNGLCAVVSLPVSV